MLVEQFPYCSQFNTATRYGTRSSIIGEYILNGLHLSQLLCRTGLVYFVFDALHLDGEDDLLLMPLLERQARLAAVMNGAPSALQFSDHVIGNGAAFFRQACKLGAEGIVSKRADAPYRPGDRSGAWLKTKCLNREEFIIVGWTDPEGSRPHPGALLLAYYDLTAGSCMPGALAPACLCASWRGSKPG